MLGHYQVDLLQLQIVIAGYYVLHNYRHVITQQLYQLWKVRSARSLSPQIASDVLLVSA
jgi:hypothetical protein